MTWGEYEAYLQRAKAIQQIEQQLTANASTERIAKMGLSAANPAIRSVLDSPAPEFPCPTGDCPPPTVNIFCQPHPDTERFADQVIIKFSSLDESTLNQFGVTRQFVASLGLTDSRQIGLRIAEEIRFAVENIFPKADPGLLGAQQANEINLLIMQQLDGFERGLAELLRQGVAGALGNAATVYDKILEVAYAGVPCPDATIGRGPRRTWHRSTRPARLNAPPSRAASSASPTITFLTAVCSEQPG